MAEKIGKCSSFVLRSAAIKLTMRWEKSIRGNFKQIYKKFCETKFANAFLEGLNFLENAAFIFYACVPSLQNVCFHTI
jgi:hypothetical protein